MNEPEPQNRELAEHLRAYADARLSPDPATMTRLRAELVQRASVPAADDTAKPPLAPAAIDGWRRSRGRRFAVSLLAASLGLMLMAGVVSAARPGGPFYPLRIWVESATLPAEPAARAAAELARLEVRLDEAEAAAAAGDGPAVTAALDAYRASLEAATSPGLPEAAPPGLEIALTRHVEVLDGLVERVPEPARGAIQQALERVMERGFPGPRDPPAGPDAPGPPFPDGVPPARPDGVPPARPDAPPNVVPPAPGPPDAPGRAPNRPTP